MKNVHTFILGITVLTLLSACENTANFPSAAIYTPAPTEPMNKYDVYLQNPLE